MITLDERTAQTVAIYFAQTRQPAIQSMLPQKAQSIEEALQDYQETLLPSATSFGRIIQVDGRYIGDVWCYCIDQTRTPNAMLSYCLFDTSYWHQGIATEAVRLFLNEAARRLALKTIGAFVFADNVASIRVLEKLGFSLLEAFSEEGRASRYYQYSFT